MFLAVWDHQQGVWGNVGPGHSPSLHSCMLLHHLTTRVGCDLFPGPDVIWMIKTLKEGAWGQILRGAKGCSLKQVCVWLLVHCWDVMWHLEPLRWAFPASVCTQHYSKTNDDMSCPQTPSKLRCGEICTVLQNISGNCVHLPLKLGETEVSLQDLWKPRPLKSTAWWISKLILLKLFIKILFFFLVIIKSFKSHLLGMLLTSCTTVSITNISS